MKNYLIYPKSHDPKKHAVIYQSVFVADEKDAIELDKTYNVCDLTGKDVDIKALKEKKKENKNV